MIDESVKYERAAVSYGGDGGGASSTFPISQLTQSFQLNRYFYLWIGLSNLFATVSSPVIPRFKSAPAINLALYGLQSGIRQSSRILLPFARNVTDVENFLI
jgi:hypothetical protein